MCIALIPVYLVYFAEVFEVNLQSFLQTVSRVELG